MKKICIFGAGAIGREAYQYLKSGNEIICFIDNNSKIWNTILLDLPVISLAEYKEKYDGVEIVIACAFTWQIEIEKELVSQGIKAYSFFDRNKYIKKVRLVSYCMKKELEDVILYHLFKDEKNIFYIDVGSNDPFAGSVTKLLYDMKSATGINVEPQITMFNRNCLERPKDINLNVGLGRENGIGDIYIQDGCSTFVKQNILSNQIESQRIEIKTLSNICNEYVVDNNISFIKIDVEGFEKEVLLGADLVNFRPKLIMVESTIPNSDIPNFEEWESILFDAGYCYIYQRGVNRYYIENENTDLKNRFADIDEIEDLYDIWFAQIHK